MAGTGGPVASHLIPFYQLRDARGQRALLPKTAEPIRVAARDVNKQNALTI